MVNNGMIAVEVNLVWVMADEVPIENNCEKIIFCIFIHERANHFDGKLQY